MARFANTAGFLEKIAEIAQLVEHNLAKVGVASSSLVFRSYFFAYFFGYYFCFLLLFLIRYECLREILRWRGRGIFI